MVQKQQGWKKSKHVAHSNRRLGKEKQVLLLRCDSNATWTFCGMLNLTFLKAVQLDTGTQMIVNSNLKWNLPCYRKKVATYIEATGLSCQMLTYCNEALQLCELHWVQFLVYCRYMLFCSTDPHQHNHTQNDRQVTSIHPWHIYFLWTLQSLFLQRRISHRDFLCVWINGVTSGWFKFCLAGRLHNRLGLSSSLWH